jgi:hypothetical protein
VDKAARGEKGKEKRKGQSRRYATEPWRPGTNWSAIMDPVYPAANIGEPDLHGAAVPIFLVHGRIRAKRIRSSEGATTRL